MLRDAMHLYDANRYARAVALFILAMSFGVTFGFAFLATAVILLPRDKDSFDRM